jgi:hypothetical protein
LEGNTLRQKVYAVQWIPTGEVVSIETTKYQAHNYRSYDGPETRKEFEVVAYYLEPVNEKEND